MTATRHTTEKDAKEAFAKWFLMRTQNKEPGTEHLSMFPSMREAWYAAWKAVKLNSYNQQQSEQEFKKWFKNQKKNSFDGGFWITFLAGWNSARESGK